MKLNRRGTDRDRTRAWLALAGLLAALLLALAVLAGGWALSGAALGSPAPASAASPAVGVGHGAHVALVQVAVSRVVDGDTIHVTMPDGSDETVRLIGVNTPESTTRHEPYGTEASDYAKRRLPKGLVVWLQTDVRPRDRYGRLLAYVWLAEPTADSPDEIRAKMFNAELLVEGYAQLMTIPPDVRYADAFTPLQAEARGAGRGLWSLAGR